MTRRAAIYARVSSDEQARPDRASIAHQVAECRRLAAADGHTEPVEFLDDESGQIAGRPGMSELLGRLDEFAAVYIYHADRLARRRSVATTLREQFTLAGVTLRLVHGDTSTMDDESRVFLESIQDAASEAEIIRLRRRTRMGRERRAQLGRHAGNPPSGYVVVRDRLGRSVSLEPDPAWDRFFRDLEEMFLAGTPYSRLGLALQARGHVTPRTGRAYSVPALRYMVANPWYYGHVVFGYTSRDPDDTLEQRDAHPPRWSDPAAMRRELERRSHLVGRGRWQAYPFSGLLRCARCHWRMTANPKRYVWRDGSRTSHYVRYRCSQHAEYLSGRRLEPCEANYIAETKVAAQLAAWFERLRDEEAMKQALAALTGQDRQALRERVSGLEQRVREIDRLLIGLTDRLGLVPAGALDAVRERMGQLATERQEQDDRLREARLAVERIPDPGALYDQIADIAIDPAAFSRKPAHEVQAALANVFPAGIYVSAGMLLLP